LGIASPAWLNAITPQSPARPRREAANMPSGTAIAHDRRKAISASGAVTASRSPISPATGTP